MNISPRADAPAGRLVGYARVSTFGQTLEAQLEQLAAIGCTKVYREKASGARPPTPPKNK